MSRLSMQYRIRNGRSPKKWEGRPDLMGRVERVLAAPTLKEVSAQQIADHLREPAGQVWDCLAYLNDQYDLVELPVGMKGQKRSVIYKLMWKVNSGQQGMLDATNAILLFAPGEEKKKEAIQCPGCGRLLRRRHGRKEYHDPYKCQMFNLRDIMDK